MNGNNFKFSDYGIFSDASNTANTLKDAISNVKAAFNKAEKMAQIAEIIKISK